MLGKILSSRYKIIKHLGGGGFGQTYLAEDLQLPGNPLCVVKQLKPKATDSFTLETARRLFDREAQVLYLLGSHEQIPRLLAHFEEEQEFYLVQEFIEGDDLKEELPFGKQLSEAQVITLCRDILKILKFVHQQNVIHRDIKPSNLMRRKQDGKIVLIDFGAVKQVSTQNINAQKDTSLTVSIGSPGYMPNEQLGGKPQFCSDIYAVGMLGIQALTGVPPHQLPEDPKTSEILLRELLLNNSLYGQMQASTGLADVLEKMVRYDYRQRYQTATEALQALEELSYLHQSPPTAPLFPVPLAASANTTETVPLSSSPQGSPSGLHSITESSVPLIAPTQALQTDEQIISNSSVNSLESKANSQTSDGRVYPPHTQFPQLQLKRIGTGIATSIALIVGIYYFQGRQLSAIEKQWVQKIALSASLTGNSTYINPVALSPNGNTLVSGGEDGGIRLWELRTRQLRSTFKGHSSAVYTVAISNDGQILASSSADETLKVWQLSTGKLLHTLANNSKAIRSIAISSDSQTLVSGDADGKIEIWNLGTGEPLNSFSGHATQVSSLAISPDGQTLVSGSTDKTIKLWELKTGGLRTLTDNKSRPVTAVAINPNGETFASGDVDGAIKLWDLQSGKLVQTLMAGLGKIDSVAFRPNGRTLVSGGGDGAIKLWDLHAGKLIRTLSGHSEPVNSLVISPDGKTVVSSSQDKTIKIWRSP